MKHFRRIGTVVLTGGVVLGGLTLGQGRHTPCPRR
jgi:hypothetical protein